jgi:hypothetical protein
VEFSGGGLIAGGAIAGRLIASGNQIFAHDGEGRHQLGLGGRVDTMEGFGAGVVAKFAHTGQDRVGLLGKKQVPDAAVARVGPTLDEATGFELIEDPDEGDGLDIEDVRQASLVNAFDRGKKCQDLPLGSGEAEATGILLEALAKEACDVVQDETEGWGISRHRACCEGAYDRLVGIFFWFGKMKEPLPPAPELGGKG